jgi:hypothetical protein
MSETLQLILMGIVISTPASLSALWFLCTPNKWFYVKISVLITTPLFLFIFVNTKFFAITYAVLGPMILFKSIAVFLASKGYQKFARFLLVLPVIFSLFGGYWLAEILRNLHG